MIFFQVLEWLPSFLACRPFDHVIRFVPGKPPNVFDSFLLYPDSELSMTLYLE